MALLQLAPQTGQILNLAFNLIHCRVKARPLPLECRQRIRQALDYICPLPFVLGWLWCVMAAVEAGSVRLSFASGAILVASKDYSAPKIHMFYGFLAFLTVGFAYQYRHSMRGRREMLYGLVGLFIMGLGIRAVLQVS